MAFGSSADPVINNSIFIKNSINLAKNKAAKENKVIMVHFYADWCLPCKWMDENTFTDARVVRILKDDFVALKVNIDDFDGFPVKQKYKVEYLPTILFLNEKGEEITRFIEALPPSKLITALNANSKKDSKVVATKKTEDAPAPMTKESNVKVEVKKNEAPVVEVKKTETVPAVIKSNPAEETKTESESQNTAVADNNAMDLENIEADLVNSGQKVYRVQVGIFSDIVKVDELRNQLVNKLNKPFMIEMDSKPGKKTRFILFLGKYLNIADARECAKLVNQELNTESFVREMIQY
jgi:thiol-disulfide isomerase/thioredoxin